MNAGEETSHDRDMPGGCEKDGDDHMIRLHPQPLRINVGLVIQLPGGILNLFLAGLADPGFVSQTAQDHGNVSDAHAGKLCDLF